MLKDYIIVKGYYIVDELLLKEICLKYEKFIFIEVSFGIVVL